MYHKSHKNPCFTPAPIRGSKHSSLISIWLRQSKEKCPNDQEMYFFKLLKDQLKLITYSDSKYVIFTISHNTCIPIHDILLVAPHISVAHGLIYTLSNCMRHERKFPVPKMQCSISTIKVALGGSLRSQYNHDLSICYLLYDLGRQSQRSELPTKPIMAAKNILPPISLTVSKGVSAFHWISAQPLSEPLLNMHTTFYMSVIIIHETNALGEVLWQEVCKFLLKSTITLWLQKILTTWQPPGTT